MSSLPDPNRPSTAKSVTEPTSISEGWRHHLLKTKGDPPHPLALSANAKTAFSESPEWAGCLAYDESSLKIVVRAPLPPSIWTKPRTPPFNWTEDDDFNAAVWLQRENIHLGRDVAGQAIHNVAMLNPFHPIREYLDSLTWDEEEERVPTWAAHYLGCERRPIVMEMAACWLIAAVARAYSPGCQADSMLVLEGSQGTYKSSALRILGGEWFTDELSDFGTKDAKIEMQGKWIIELGELEALVKATSGEAKTVISRRVEYFRPPYERRARDVPRGCVLAGTTNHSNWGKDETGARRFWPLKTGWINLKALVRDRDQLWAEAKWRYFNNEPWHLTSSDSVRQAEREQAARFEGDPWIDEIEAWLEGKGAVTMLDVLYKAVERPKGQANDKDLKRAKRALVFLGWERRQVREGKKTVWKYVRKGH